MRAGIIAIAAAFAALYGSVSQAQDATAQPERIAAQSGEILYVPVDQAQDITAQPEQIAAEPLQIAAGHEGADAYTRSGWYLGASGVYGIHLFESDVEDALGFGAEVDKSWGISGRVGYRFKPWLSAEAEIEYLDGFEVKQDDVGRIFNLESLVGTVNAVFHWPLERWQPSFKLGIGAVDYSVNDVLGLGVNFESDTAVAGRIGAGLDYYFTESVVGHVGADVILTSADLGNVTARESLTGVYYLSLQFGLAYRF